MSEHKLKEYEDVYLKIEKIINSCDTIPQLEMCGDNLVDLFRKKNFKRDTPPKNEQEVMAEQLEEHVKKKKNAIRNRIFHERKNGN